MDYHVMGTAKKVVFLKNGQFCDDEKQHTNKFLQPTMFTLSLTFSFFIHYF
jgi:hypothetical protein